MVVCQTIEFDTDPTNETENTTRSTSYNAVCCLETRMSRGHKLLLTWVAKLVTALGTSYISELMAWYTSHLLSTQRSIL